MFPYFEISPYVFISDDPFSDEMKNLTVFFLFFLLPIQFIVKIFLTVYEVRIYLRLKNWISMHLLTIAFTVYQWLLPLVEMNEYKGYLTKNIQIWSGFKYTLQGIKSNYLTFGFMFLLYKVKSLPLANYYI